MDASARGHIVLLQDWESPWFVTEQGKTWGGGRVGGGGEETKNQQPPSTEKQQQTNKQTSKL